MPYPIWAEANQWFIHTSGWTGRGCCPVDKCNGLSLTRVQAGCQPKPTCIIIMSQYKLWQLSRPPLEPSHAGWNQGSPKTGLHRPILWLWQPQGNICSGGNWGTKIANSAVRQDNSDHFGGWVKSVKVMSKCMDFMVFFFTPCPNSAFKNSRG